MMVDIEREKYYYMIPLKNRNEGDLNWFAYQDYQAKFLSYDLRIWTAAHGWRHIEDVDYQGCLIKITYLDDGGNSWYYFKKPDSLVTVEIPDDPDNAPQEDDGPVAFCGED